MPTTYQIHQGDIIAWCQNYKAKINAFEAEPFHTTFADWPYLLDFMGQGMRDAPHRALLKDSQRGPQAAGLADVLGVELWEAAAFLWYRDVAEALASVMLPGALLLAFAGPRTDDLLSMALRGAGWLVQDKLMYLYGSGMPHGLALDKAIDAMAGRIGHSTESLKLRLIELFKASGKTKGQIDAECGFCASKYLTLSREGNMPDPWVFVLPSVEKWRIIKQVIGCPEDVGHEMEALFTSAQREVTARIIRKTPGWFTGRDVYDETAPGSSEAGGWVDYNTHLKPSYETIILAYRPLAATYAETALRFGTPGLNIGGCRIERGGAAGNWPPNTLLQHHEDCNGDCVPGCPVALLGEQSGVTKSRVSRRGNMVRAPGDSCGGAHAALGDETNTIRGYTDAGTAARFFYTAKAGPWEREFGLDGMPTYMQHRVKVNSHGVPTGLGEEPRWAPKETRNPHPTLKAIRALEYLARLIKRPQTVDGRLLVPFAGTGSEMIGAHLAGWRHIQGIELDQDHLYPGAFVPIAHARLAAWTQYTTYDEVRRAAGEPDEQEQPADTAPRMLQESFF